MNVLLLLSALLSALTGVTGAVRRAEPVALAEQMATARVQSVRPVALASRSHPSAPRLIAEARAVAMAAPRLPRIALYLSRRRE